MLRIGVLGAAGIAPAVVIRPASRRNDVEVVGVASRRPGAAADYAARHGIAAAYDSYDQLIAATEIDLVYNALPPSEHAAWTIRALEAGKHVLCEKPFAMNADEARRMRAAADRSGSRLIEAFHDRYHPLSRELDAIRSSGRLGEIRSVEAEFSASIPFDAVSIRHDPRAGGGALMDLGCYPVHWVRAFLNEEPAVASATATLNPLGTDMSMFASLVFPSGVTATVRCSMQDGPIIQRMTIISTNGIVEVEGLIFPSLGHSIRETVGGVLRVRTVAGAETYDHQLEAIVRGLESGEPLLTEGEDSVRNMLLIDEIYRAAGLRS